MIQLKGMTWSHARGIDPLVAASQMFKERTGVEITWDARSLSDFELFPLDQLAEKYDFIMIDHPHIGIAHAQALLMPLEGQVSQALLEDQAQYSVGQSYASYSWEGHQYALPLDAAAQVGAYREDTLKNLGLAIPQTWEAVFALAKQLPTNQCLAIPFVPVHAYSSFFTLCAHFSEKIFWSDETPLTHEAGTQALDILCRLLQVAHPDSKDMDPIDMLDRMCEQEEIVYSPLVYGYSNYAREDYAAHVVRFIDMPYAHTQPSGSMIGGVGLSITSKTKHPKEALQFAEMVAAPDFQKTVLFDNGGQPGHLQAWTDAHVNEDSNGFFADSLETLRLGSMRPRFAGYIDFQAEAGIRIRDFVLANREDKTAFIDELNALIVQCRAQQGL